MVKCHRSARASIIETAVLIGDALDRFAKHRDALDAFFAVLGEGGVLAPVDARLGENASKISVYRKVCQHAEMLTNFGHHLDPSLYIYYDTARLYEMVGEDDRKLEGHLKAMAPLGISRESLQQAIREEKLGKQRAAGNGAGAVVQADASSPTSPHAQALLSTREFSLVLATPSAADLRLIRRDMADPSAKTPRCMRVHECMSDTAVLLAVSSVIDLPTVAQRLLPYCGFSEASHVFLLDDPQEHEVTKCRALLIARRGQYEVPIARIRDAITNQLSAVGLAELFATGDDGRLHLFADEAATGWTTFVGRENWSSEDVR